MPYFTVFTPTYNRGYIIENLYNSLCMQTNKDFEWLIIDDGSTDATNELVSNWVAKDNGFCIRYIYKENGGKPRAINDGLKHAKGKFFFMVDSDDILTKDAIEKMNKWCKEIKNDNHIVGVGASIGEFEGGYFMGKVPKIDKNSYIEITNLERKNYNLDVDTREAYKVDIMKKFPMFTYPGEKFAPEQIALNEMALHGYRLRWYPEIIYLQKYLNDGLTKGSHSLEKNNPMGYAMMYNHMLKYPTLSLREKLSAAFQSNILLLYAGNLKYIFKSNDIILSLITLPLSYIWYFRRKKQFEELS